MKFKGISEVIATLLMLIITIALAGTAYLYISGFFQSKTTVVLSIDPALSYCNSSHVTVVVRNDGTQEATNVNVAVTAPDGTTLSAGTPYSSLNIRPGHYNQTYFDRSSKGTGYYRIVAYTSGSGVSGTIYCP